MQMNSWRLNNVQEIKEGYPLHWPPHWKRTPEYKRRHSIFRNTFARSRDELLNEIRLLGGRYPVISSNLMLKIDGFPYANQKEPEDPGVAVYFELFGKQQCIPCDKWKKTLDNIIAVQKTINALRGIERWGAKEMVEAAFQGFQALPAPDDVIPIEKQYFVNCHSKEDAKKLYHNLVKRMHPDVGGNVDEFNEMKRQYEQRFKN